MIRDALKKEKDRILENQKKKLRELTFMEVFYLFARLAQVYGGLWLLDWGVKLYDSGQSLEIVQADPRVTSLFIIVTLAIIFMVQ
jgi:hypothetical protein